MNILVLGVTGMLGNSMFRFLSQQQGYKIYGTMRGHNANISARDISSAQIITGVDVENHDSLVAVFAEAKPKVVINCIGFIKQLSSASEPLQAIPINSILPHRIAAMCEIVGARLIHISTDCVFSGSKGNYKEEDFPDAHDLYGRSKLLGEVDYPHAITLRTSIIGHELSGNKSLISWFLSQTNEVKGYTNAIYSGIPTVELARVVKDFVLPHPQLKGLYHVAAKPINKFELLTLVAKIYKKDIKINPSKDVIIDRSLNAERFYQATGYNPPKWEELIEKMNEFNVCKLGGLNPSPSGEDFNMI